MTTIKQALKEAQIQSPTAKLDAELLLLKILNKERTYLYTYPETILDEKQKKAYQNLIQQAKTGTPIAYLLGEKEFWSRKFIVNKSCLIPRPETELIIEWCLQNLPQKKPLHILDLGTGTGAIAITLALERSTWHIAATDINDKALHLCKQNATRHNAAHITFHHGDWFTPVKNLTFDVIISNPPYIAKDDKNTQSLKHEPANALISPDNGYLDLATIINNAPQHLNPKGYLILEHGYQQQNKVVKLLQMAGYQNIQRHQDYAGQDRMVVAETTG